MFSIELSSGVFSLESCARFNLQTVPVAAHRSVPNRADKSIAKYIDRNNSTLNSHQGLVLGSRSESNRRPSICANRGDKTNSKIFINKNIFC
jgi:16S rRNA G1207 methylase RsmC